MPKKRRDHKRKTAERGIYRLNRSNTGYLIRVTKRHPISRKTVFKQRKVKAESLSDAILAREGLRKELEKELNLKTFGGVTPLQTLTVGELFEHYIEDRRPQVKAITLRQLNLMAEWFLFPILGDVKVRDISRGTVKYYHSELLKLKNHQGNSYSNHTLKQASTVLKTFLRWCVREEILETNPTTEIHIRGGRRAKEKQTLSMEEALLFLNAGKLHLPLKEFLMIAMAIVYGCRHGEMAALTWDDVDFDRGVIFIHKTVSAQRLSDTTKTGRNNVLIMLPQIRMLLREHKAGQRESKNPLNLVFPSRVVGKYREPPSINYNIRKLLRIFEINKDVTVHGLRHTAISLMIQEGINAEIVRKIVNHSPGSQVTRQYIHSDRQHTQASLMKVWDKFEV